MGHGVLRVWVASLESFCIISPHSLISLISLIFLISLISLISPLPTPF
ncbi:hypothetical protein H1Q63_15465 [Desmonostoc muscorum CCALA 125]|nr:hypothetical protein [Desmonostoc muscorum CCALA 125]